jgi:hypothetical protein
VGVSSVEGFNRVDFKLIHVLDDPSGTLKNTKCPTLGDMFQDRSVARLHLLITALPLTGVVKTAIGLPPVVITVRLAGLRIREDEDVWRLT